MPLHEFTSGLQLGYGIQPVNPVPVDSFSGPYAAGTTTAAVALANATIPAALRFLSLEVRILAPYEGATLAYKYWYRGSTADNGLVEFSSASTSSGVTLAVAGAGIVLSPAGGTGTVTFINNGVLSFNGNTGAVSGASLGANTFTGLNTFNSGITTSSIYSSTGSTFGGTLKVVGGATFDSRVDVAGILDVAGGVTLEQTLNVISVAKFHSNVSLGDESTDTVTATGTFQGLTVSNGLLIANAGITTAFIYASAGSTFGGTLKVIGGATFDSTTDHAGVARFAAGLTTSSLDVTGVSKFNGNITLGDAAADTITATGTFQGLTVSNGLLTANAGITTAFIYASTGSTFGGTLKVVGGATFDSTTDHAGAARFAVGLTSSGDVVVGSAGTVLKTNGDATIGATLTVNGNFFVTGTVTTVNRTDLSIDDKIITLGRTLADDALANNGGLVLKGTSDRTLLWSDSADAWTSNDNFNVSGNTYGYKIDNTTALALGMVQGLSASAGTITGGTWAANLIGLTYGGTNKNLAAVGASGGVVYKDGTGLTITAAGTNSQILQANSSGAPVWVNTTSLTGITADRVKTNDTNSGIYYLTFVAGVCASTDLLVDTAAGVTYNAASGVLSCVQLEALVDGGTF